MTNFSPSLLNSLSESDEEEDGSEGIGVLPDIHDDVEVYVIRLVSSERSDDGQTSYPVSLDLVPLRGPLGVWLSEPEAGV